MLVHKRKYQILVFLQLIFTLCFSKSVHHNMSIRRFTTLERVETPTKCKIPRIDPFSPEIMKFHKPSPKITCPGEDYIKCYLSKCRIANEDMIDPLDLLCVYKDIIYDTDHETHLGKSTVVRGFDAYTLTDSDHVEITCRIANMVEKKYEWWYGHGWGVRSTVNMTRTEQSDKVDMEQPINVLMIGYDSMSHNAFIRKMPRSYKYLRDMLQATVLNGYNVIGDGTPAALIPLLTGRSQSEWFLKPKKSNGHVNHRVFLFHKLKKYGYRTAYFEDMPEVGTFTLNYPGFRTQPADHYSRSFYKVVASHTHNNKKDDKYCIGDTPSYQVLLNLSHQVLTMPGKKFVFTMIADISHDDINLVGAADEEFSEYLKGLEGEGHFNNTLLIIFGDHGPRYGHLRATYTGRFEERLPLMAIRLPTNLRRQQRHLDIKKVLESNKDVLTTPLDIHATILDVMNLQHLWDYYKVQGGYQLRGLTLLEKISPNRTCYEADVDMHWCTCLNLIDVPIRNPRFKRAANAVVDAINWYIQPQRHWCAERNLKQIEWVKQISNHGFNMMDPATMMYQVKLSVGPGHGEYEATVNYKLNTDEYNVHVYQISRTNRYYDEPACILKEYPHLRKFCYCKNH